MIDGQFNLYSTHFVSENDLYYDCLHYKVMNDIGNYDNMHYFQRSYQIIKYCIRPFENLDKTIEVSTGAIWIFGDKNNLVLGLGEPRKVS
jgi:hypothetical protein